MNKNLKRTCSQKRSGALHLTQKADYGIMLLCALAKNSGEEILSIKEISREKNLSFSFLQKVARILQKAKIIKAQRGKYGGYKLTKPAKTLQLSEIIETLEGPIALVPCLKRRIITSCNRNSNCEVRSGLQKINQEIFDFLSSKTLDQLIS